MDDDVLFENGFFILFWETLVIYKNSAILIEFDVLSFKLSITNILKIVEKRPF